ncbi:MAG: hypothetical protein ACI9G1_001013 [Pirellulaceae bacterium]|jgi:hypothetical protein
MKILFPLFLTKANRIRVAGVLLLIAFLVVTWNASAVADVGSHDVVDVFAGDPWRRTINGWENSSTWEVEREIDLLARIAQLHPFVVASFQVLVCVGALVAFSDDEDWQRLPARAGKG